MFSLILSYKINKLTKNEASKIQYKRVKLLKKYYLDNNLSTKEIILINEQLTEKFGELQKQSTTLLIIFGMIIFPIWENFLQYAFKEFTSSKVLKIFLLSIILSCLIVLVIKIYNIGSHLYQENIPIKNNKYIIKNLIYLNTYIINERNEMKTYGRKK